MHLFLSPHLDDAIYSCGATIHAMTAAGETVTILNIMAGNPPVPLPDTPIVQELHARWGSGSSPVALRRQEDRLAAARVQATALYLPLADCIYRTNARHQPLYTEGAHLWRHVHADDPALKWLSAYSLKQHLPPIKRIYAPLAAGEHVDHVIVRQWAIQLQHNDPQLALWWYEDYPYREKPQAVQEALAHLGDGQPTRHDLPVTEADIQAKVEAAAAYQSQLSTFWQDAHEMETRIRQDLRHKTAVFAETFYTF